ncbi:SDR family NAD(P)-dependent oxidoreductase [Hydrogenivirga sp. 128-5-R1-1]|uniref:SDR family NAD(P)-dependent oxidoreductase n=1 Tax=Hydrogenivirga sp. 128-5-R1-1 TaxID=392423 RepID=UPI00015EF95A|nr:SDR family NAD(P)-dependent oxidoreductase [Hydrogenivirga sp. 128-5-R1-1]EDP75202.1 alcohol dehydrogenase [Hydrogenivirga sp. 128-5-R1-1]
MRLFITGVGSGLGKALAETALRRGYEVYALSRHLPEELKGKVKFVRCDLRELERVEGCVRSLLEGVDFLDLVILNAGILGEFGDMREVSLYRFREVMDLNVWANKVILDTLVDIKVEQIIGISSGASVNCNRGWNAYSISKASLNCLLKLYAREMENTHIIALAPGLVLTPMLEEVMKQDTDKYPSVRRIIESPKRTPEETAELIFEILPKLKEYESGSYVDVRKM